MIIALVQRYRQLALRYQGATLDSTSHIGPAVTLGRITPRQGGGSVTIGPECEVQKGAELAPWGGRIAIGRRVFIGPYAVIYGHGGVEIGEETLISAHCGIFSANHTVPGRNEFIRHKPDIPQPVKIGKDVWIGAGTKVLAGVTIGDGCVVGAGAVVTRDLPAYSIAFGVPASVVGSR